MSWSTSFVKPVPKHEVDAAIDALTPGYVIPGESFDQLRQAKKVAKELATIVPGPFIMVSLAGHANGVGWQEKSGMANDGISVSVTQVTTQPT